MSELNDDMWEQIELNNYGKGKLVHIVNEQAELIRLLYEQLQQAHLEGWEQAKREAKSTILDHFTCCDFTHGCDHDWCNMLKEIADAIAAMEYKEKAND